MLEKLPPIADPRVLVSEGTVDDAGVYLLGDGTALVFTVDFFTPIVDDPRDYGRIAAANSFSDVYAMGGRPLIALNILCFPETELPPEVMTEILLGGEDVAREAGVSIVGGHSVSDLELKYGLAVVGTVDPGRVVTNAGAKTGQAIVLTKPVGVGVLMTALKLGKLAPGRLAAATAVMRRLNRAASEAMSGAGASAATDVTGFGLAGHAISMARASRVTIEIDLARVPVLDGVREILSEGIAPGGLGMNREYYGKQASCAPDAREAAEVLYDPQTSGGLLIALDEDRVAAFRAAVARRGEEAWVIGRTAAEGPTPLVIR